MLGLHARPADVVDFSAAVTQATESLAVTRGAFFDALGTFAATGYPASFDRAYSLGSQLNSRLGSRMLLLANLGHDRVGNGAAAELLNTEQALRAQYLGRITGDEHFFERATAMQFAARAVMDHGNECSVIQSAARLHFEAIRQDLHDLRTTNLPRRLKAVNLFE